MDFAFNYSSSACSDYTSTTADITFEVGSTRLIVAVPITDDNDVENVEIFTATLSSLESNVIIGYGIATLRIVDNDG